jgi:hypothetical protein
MMNARSSRIVGVALIGFGALILAFSFWSGAPSTLRIAGPLVAFFGIVMLAQARASGERR